MKIRIIKCASGYYAVMVWDLSRNGWSCWWSGSKRISDAIRVTEKLLHRK